jgi:hypothetical protein
MKQSLFVLLLLALLQGCSVKVENINNESTKERQLAIDIMALSARIDKKEAQSIAKEALSYPKVLAKQYNLVTPASYHNMLINLGYRTRGLCFHWSEDLMAHLKKQKYKTVDFRWGVSDKGGEEEHNSVVVLAKGASFESGLILDPWRNSGDLYWTRIGYDEKFKWYEDKKRTTVLGTVNVIR